MEALVEAAAHLLTEPTPAPVARERPGLSSWSHIDDWERLMDTTTTINSATTFN